MEFRGEISKLERSPIPITLALSPSLALSLWRYFMHAKNHHSDFNIRVYGTLTNHHTNMWFTTKGLLVTLLYDDVAYVDTTSAKVSVADLVAFNQ